MNEYKGLHLFAGIGGAALGFQEARTEYKGMVGQFHTLAGIDCDPEACQDFENLTGAPAVQMDLFSRDDYMAFHGQEPPGDWAEVRPIDLLETTRGEHPDVVFLSPPCKGFSGLLPSEKSKSEKYQALNRLVVRGLQLVMDAYTDDLPAVIMLENVPRITSRGEFLLKQVKSLLGKYGYVFHEGTHDCGELGGLGQRRKRYLLVARLPEKMTSFIYRPPKKRLKSIGDVIGPLPMPDDPAMGPMHRLPRLQRKTWVRLALISAGGDWRDLEHCEKYSIEYIGRDGSGTVVGHVRVGHSNGVAAISDPRTYFKDSTHHAIYRVMPWDEPSNTVTGAMRPNNGAISIADPRLGCSCRSGSYGVQDWNQPGKTVTGAGDIHSGSSAIADPRIPKDTEVLDPPPVIISVDGTWHRPLTTLELAVLQSLKPYMSDGRPLQLAGNSDARWRERIGNMVPVQAAQAIAEEILLSFLASEAKEEFRLTAAGIWVVPEDKENQYVGGMMN